jgi:hypothetical protein
MSKWGRLPIACISVYRYPYDLFYETQNVLKIFEPIGIIRDARPLINRDTTLVYDPFQGRAIPNPIVGIKGVGDQWNGKLP